VKIEKESLIKDKNSNQFHINFINKFLNEKKLFLKNHIFLNQILIKHKPISVFSNSEGKFSN